MGKETLIIKNITRERPGLIEEVLKERGFPYKVIDLSLGDSIPDQSSFDVLIVMGGPDSANDTTDKMRFELQLIKDSVESGKPYLGICLGLQTLVKAMGGRVVKGEVKEIGFRNQANELNTITLTDNGKADALFKGLGDEFKVFHLHGETVELTGSMKLLGKGQDVPNQVVKIGKKAYGIQCHFELTPDMLKTWLAEDSDLQTVRQEDIQRDFEEIKEEYEQIGKQLIKNFLDLISAQSRQPI